MPKYQYSSERGYLDVHFDVEFPATMTAEQMERIKAVF